MSDDTALELFRFDDDQIAVFLVDGRPWFVGSDLARVLEYRDAANALRSVRDKNKGTQIVRTPGGQQEKLCVNEPGLTLLQWWQPTLDAS